MMNLKEWLFFLKAKWLEMIVVICMVLCGSVYACYRLSNGSGLEDQVMSYFTSGNEHTTMEIFCLTLLSHLKVIGMVWFLGLLTYFRRANVILIAGLIFAYSFTITSFLGSVGAKNNFLLWTSLIIQGVLVVSYLMTFYGATLENKMKIKKYGVEILKGCLVCIFITMLELF